MDLYTSIHLYTIIIPSYGYMGWHWLKIHLFKIHRWASQVSSVASASWTSPSCVQWLGQLEIQPASPAKLETGWCKEKLGVHLASIMCPGCKTARKTQLRLNWVNSLLVLLADRKTAGVARPKLYLTGINCHWEQIPRCPTNKHEWTIDWYPQNLAKEVLGRLFLPKILWFSRSMGGGGNSRFGETQPAAPSR